VVLQKRQTGHSGRAGQGSRSTTPPYTNGLEPSQADTATDRLESRLNLFVLDRYCRLWCYRRRGQVRQSAT
jgi:hypothetical protein